MSVVIFRTDSTDLFAPGKNPRMMRLQAALFTKTWERVTNLDALIRPEGWVPNAGATATHGITTRRCDLYGTRARSALSVFMDMVRAAKEVASFSIAFHAGIVDVELRILKAKPEEWKRSGVIKTCIMQKASEKWRDGSPIKIEEAYAAAFPGWEFSGDKFEASIAILKEIRGYHG